MISRAYKFRIRRLLRLRKIQVEEIGVQAEEGLERNFFKRIDRLSGVKRFVFGWLSLVILLAGITLAQTLQLSNYFQTLKPVPGAAYTEGIIGQFTNANPVYAQNPVDTTVSKLIFASLFEYNDQNMLIGDLATGYTTNNLGTVYTVKLKPNLKWQDGQPLTAYDVAYTYHVIQNPDAQSPLYNSWQNVSVSAVNPQTVTFTLSNPLASFPYSLTNGIIPQHILGGTSMEDMRSAMFNTNDPIGAGPFSWAGIETAPGSSGSQNVQIALKPFAGYTGGKPKLDSFNIITYSDENSMISAFNKQDLSAMVGLNNLPDQLKGKSNVWTYSLPQTAAVYSFFKTTDGVLADSNVRQALIKAVNTQSIINNLGYPTNPVVEPLLRDQLGFNATYAQAGYSTESANSTLDADGWVMGTDGFRYKAGKQLAFNLYTEDTSEYNMVANTLASDWRQVGANVQVISQDAETFQNTLSYHSYDALLCGIDIGVDPDVFVYWDSSQSDIRSPERLNFSEWSNPTADEALEGGRTRLDPALRIIKYEPFLKSWQTDAPAMGLYQTRFLYITRGPVFGLDEHMINTDTDRFSNVQNWEIQQAKVSN